MRRRFTKLCSLLSAGLCLGALLLPAGSMPARAQTREPIAVLVSSTSKISELSLGVLRAAFLNLPTTNNGERLIPLNLPPSSDVRVRFDRAVLGLGPDQVGRFWVDQRVRDARVAPRTVPTTDLAMRVAANLKGAIVYVPSGLVRSSRVRVLRIDGKLPSDPGYPLR